MVSLNKCLMISFSPKICVPKETKHISVKAFNMITNKDKAKAMTEQISCDCKFNFNRTTCNSKQKWDYETCQFESKIIISANWNPSTCIFENSKYLKRVADTSVTMNDEILLNNLSTKNTNTVATKKTNIVSTASINCHSRQVRDCCIFHKVLLAIILLLKITIIFYHYAKQKGII